MSVLSDSLYGRDIIQPPTHSEFKAAYIVHDFLHVPCAYMQQRMSHITWVICVSHMAETHAMLMLLASADVFLHLLNLSTHGNHFLTRCVLQESTARRVDLSWSCNRKVAHLGRMG